MLQCWNVDPQRRPSFTEVFRVVLTLTTLKLSTYFRREIKRVRNKIKEKTRAKHEDEYDRLNSMMNNNSYEQK